MINFDDIITGQWYFITELDVVSLQTSDNSVAFSVVDANGSVILNESYVPYDGAVNIRFMVALLTPYITEVAADFVLTCGNTSKTVHVVQCRTMVDEPAMTFLPSFWLTTVMTERDTAVGRKELLTVLPIEATVPDVVASASYWNGTQVVTASRTLAQGLTSGAVTEVDVSAALMVDNTLGTLVGYTVTCGERTMRYRVAALNTADVAMLMRNTFGAWEAVYFAGMSESSPEYTRDSAMVNGALKLYHIDEVDSVKCWTGPMRPSGVDLARDLARSTDVVLLSRGAAAAAVVITGTEMKHTTADTDLADLTVTWRRASPISTELKAKRIPRLFDETFDETYN